MSLVNMIHIIFYSLLLSKVLKFNFYLYKILWVHYSRITKTLLYYQRESRVWIPPPQPAPITLFQEGPSFWVGARCCSAWGDSHWCWWEKHLHTTALSLVSSMKESPQGTVRSKACSPLALSEAEAGNFINGNCQGVLMLPRAGTGKGTRAFSLLRGVNGVTSPHLETNLFVKAESSGSCCFRMLLF